MDLTERKNVGMDAYLLWGLIAVELFMSFSFLGYIHIEPISITLVYIPVLLAGCLMGIKEATAVGIIFGLASMWKASAFYVSDGDALFSPVMSGKPLESIFLSVGARAMFGFIMGLMYWLVKRGKHPLAGIVIITAFGRRFHSLCVYGAMGMFFPETGRTAADVITGGFELSNIFLLTIQEAAVIICYRLQNSPQMKKFAERIKTADSMGIRVLGGRRQMTAVIVVTFAAAFSVALYFIDRIGSVMLWHGLQMSEDVYYDVTHLQIQFLMGIIALFAVILLITVLWLKNFNYLYYEAKMDDLTGVLSRNQFLLLGEKLLERVKADTDSYESGEKPYFIILDVDRFKEINDKYGHPAGDRVLREIAGSLKAVLGDIGIFGRLGGDEFVALIYRPVEKTELEELLAELKKEVNNIKIHERTVSCSIGVVPVERESSFQELYQSADRLMYRAKDAERSGNQKSEHMRAS